MLKETPGWEVERNIQVPWRQLISHHVGVTRDEVLQIRPFRLCNDSASGFPMTANDFTYSLAQIVPRSAFTRMKLIGRCWRKDLDERRHRAQMVFG